MAVKAFLSLARHAPDVSLLIGHTPLDRPASARVLEKAGFTFTGMVNDEHNGKPLRVLEWQIRCPRQPAGKDDGTRAAAGGAIPTN